jgi:hypothetical protein
MADTDETTEEQPADEVDEQPEEPVVEEHSDVLTHALNVLPLIRPESPTVPVIRRLVLEVMYLREELTVMVTRARIQGWPEVPGLPVPEMPPKAPEAEVTAVRRQRRPRKVYGVRVPKALPAKRGRSGKSLPPLRGQKITKLIKGICSKPGLTASEYAVQIWGSSSTVNSVTSMAYLLKKHGFITADKGHYYPTPACKAAVG